jgi:tRNA pseudouridine55 synthase
MRTPADKMTARIYGEIFNIYKPSGPTSYDVVRKFKKYLGYKKIGHGGTLDPFAEGVLLILVGRKATRQMNKLLKLDKSYQAELKLGIATETGDPEGQPIEKDEVQELSRDLLDNAEKKFSGKIEQIPPRYSAKKINGVPAYKLARQGKKVELPPQEIEIHKLNITKKNSDLLELDVTCSSGTYIRKLGEDIAGFLGSIGYLESLKRTRIGDYHIDDAIHLENLEEKLDKTQEKLRELDLVS